MLGTSEGKIRSAVARGLLPYRRWGGRIVFLTAEVEDFLGRLPGVSVDDAVANVQARQGQGGPTLTPHNRSAMMPARDIVGEIWT
jgi:hypothetical protein